MSRAGGVGQEGRRWSRRRIEEAWRPSFEVVTEGPQIKKSFRKQMVIQYWNVTSLKCPEQQLLKMRRIASMLRKGPVILAETHSQPGSKVEMQRRMPHCTIYETGPVPIEGKSGNCGGLMFLIPSWLSFTVIEWEVILAGRAAVITISVDDEVYEIAGLYIPPYDRKIFADRICDRLKKRRRSCHRNHFG